MGLVGSRLCVKNVENLNACSSAAEQRVDNPRVGGSNPSRRTILTEAVCSGSTADPASVGESSILSSLQFCGSMVKWLHSRLLTF